MRLPAVRAVAARGTLPAVLVLAVPVAREAELAVAVERRTVRAQERRVLPARTKAVRIRMPRRSFRGRRCSMRSNEPTASLV